MKALDLEQKADENLSKFNEFLDRGEPPRDYERQLLKEHKKRIKLILEGKIIPPYEVEIQPSSVCNLTCKHCFGKVLTKKNLPNRIGEDELDIIANRINDYKSDGFEIDVAKFCGTTGEPLVNPSMMYGINLFKDLGKKVIVFTNGLWLDKKYKGKEYLEYIAKADRLNLSLDAGSEETFVKIKGRLGYQRILYNLEKLIEKREQENTNLNVTVSYVVGKENYNETSKLAKEIKNIGVDQLVFRVNFTELEDIQKISDKIIYNLDRAKEYQRDDFKVISIYSDEDIKENDSAFNSNGRKCFNQHFWACIGPDCNLYACGHRTYHGVESYGNLLKKSFKEIWESEERRNCLENLPDDNCKFCSPSSTRRNDFMTFLSNSNFEEYLEPELEYNIPDIPKMEIPLIVSNKWVDDARMPSENVYGVN